MTEGRFERWFRGLLRHPRSVAVGIGIVAVLSALGLLAIPYEGGLVTMLPEGSRARATVTFLRDADLADKVAVSVTTGSDEPDATGLTALLDRLAARFRSSPLIRKIITFPGGKSMMGELVFFLDHAPALLTAEDLIGLENRLSPEKIDECIRGVYRRMLRPEGSFLQDFLRRDPLGLGVVILDRLRELPRAFGYDMTVQDGHLIHPDGRHGLLLMDACVPLTDGPGSRQLVELLRDGIADLPPGYSADVVCGHLHTVSNERLLRADIALTATAAAIGFLVLFLIIFRDLRASIIFLIPAVSILVSINVTSFLVGSLSYMVIGFAAVMAGIAVDYGIHVYVSVRYNVDPFVAIQRIRKPVIMGGLTTLCVFVAFFLSGIPGYRQLAVLAMVSILLSITCAMLLLPPLVNKRGCALRPGGLGGGFDRGRGSWVWAVVFLVSLAGAATLLPGLRIDRSLARLDGVEQEIVDTESEFREMWGGGRAAQAIAVVGGDTYAGASGHADVLCQRVKSKRPDLTFLGLGSVWPSPATRRANLDRWRTFWTPERQQLVARHVRGAGEKYGFADDAFDPFLALIRADTPGPERLEKSAIFTQMESRFVKKRAGGYWFMSFFPDTEETLRAVGDIMGDMPDAFVVSRRALADALAEAISSEVVRISILALFLILLVTFVLMRDVRMALAALLPAATGVLWLFAVMTLTGLSINVANMMAGIVVVGLCMDYGIFMAHSWSQGERVLALTRRAVTLSAVTTLIGAGVLIFARHPALFSIGVTLVVGVASGYGAAVLGTPGLCVLLHVRRPGGTSS